ncbi:unnamed protein product [Callosobruchus maculatus]|uniref:Uncharacterized protein n=1 Tax=Callosobruchus maculatus TaxID=64391 RepID=A0A653D3E7_CALMS|nr:unnamed protein product [Callosobruchus maculatus]
MSVKKRLGPSVTENEAPRKKNKLEKWNLILKSYLEGKNKLIMKNAYRQADRQADRQTERRK